MDGTSNGARFEPAAGPHGAIVVENITITEESVVREAHHWATGRRGDSCETSDELALADLTSFVTEAVVLGARALAATAQTSETRAVEQMLREVGDKAALASTTAANTTKQAAADAAKTMATAAADAKKSITLADEQNRKDLAATVTAAKQI